MYIHHTHTCTSEGFNFSRPHILCAVGRHTGCAGNSACSHPSGKVCLVGPRHLLDRPSQIFYLFSQGRDVAFDLFLDILLCQDACFGFRVHVAYTNVQGVASFGTVDFGHYCLRACCIFYRFLVLDAYQKQAFM